MSNLRPFQIIERVCRDNLKFNGRKFSKCVENTVEAISPLPAVSKSYVLQTC